MSTAWDDAVIERAIRGGPAHLGWPPAVWVYHCSANILAGADCALFCFEPRPIVFPVEFRS